MGIGAGQGGSLKLQVMVIVPDAVAGPDIAVLLAATNDITVVALVDVVMSPTVTFPTKVQVMFTALPEIEPLMELVTWPGSGGEVLPEIDEPV